MQHARQKQSGWKTGLQYKTASKNAAQQRAQNAASHRRGRAAQRQQYRLPYLWGECE